MTFEVKHDEKNQKFYVELNNEVSFLKYRKVDDNTLDYYSTFTPVSLRGQGIAAEITYVALNYAKQKHFAVIPSCPYVERYVKEHPELDDVIKV